MKVRFFARKGADMVSADTKTVIARAKRIYAEHLQAVLEFRHLNRFVAIEPESGEYFLGDTFDEPVKAARTKHPSRLSRTIRIGQRAAFHMGACTGERVRGRSAAGTTPRAGVGVARRRAHGEIKDTRLNEACPLFPVRLPGYSIMAPDPLDFPR